MERDNFYHVDAVLLCGGIGSRIRKISGDVPKFLLDVGGKPIIQYSLDNLDVEHIKRLIVAVDYQAEQVQEWILARRLPYSEIEFSYQSRYGILPAVTSALKFLTEDTFIVCNADEIQLGFNLNQFIESYKRSNTLATILGVYSDHLYRHRILTVRENDSLVVKTELEPEHYLSNPKQKGLINGGLIIMNKRALEYYNPLHGIGWSGIIDSLCDAGQLSACIMPNVVYFNINTADEYREAAAFFEQQSCS